MFISTYMEWNARQKPSPKRNRYSFIDENTDIPTDVTSSLEIDIGISMKPSSNQE